MRLTADHDALRAADGLVVPGVGAFPAAMRAAARAPASTSSSRERARRACRCSACASGMQLLFERSDELGGAEGLGLLPGEVAPRSTRAALKLPHIGWNERALDARRRR